jgi:hypothetical protein
MSQAIKTICDLCGKEVAGGGDYWCVSMHESPKEPWQSSESVYLGRLNPDLWKPLYFCGTECLQKWANQR